MKRTKRILALVLAFVLCMAMGTTAFAAGQDDTAAPDYSITVQNAKAGETYSAFKMLDLNVDDPTDPKAFRYTVNPAWTAFAQTDAFKAIYTVDLQGYVTTTQTDQPAWSGESNFSKLIDAAAKYAADNHIPAAGSVTVAAGADTGKIELTQAGYYVVTSTLGTRAMIESTPSKAAVTINEKNEEDSIEKTVKEDSTQEYGESNDAQVGDTIEFKSKVTVAARSINVKVHDTMDSGLTLNPNSIKLYTDEALTTEYTGATIKTGSDAGDDTFTIEIPDSFAATAIASQQLFIVYTAELNKAAVKKDDSGVAIVGQKNKTTVTFGQSTTSTEETTTTTTHKFEVHKYSNSPQVDPLADAVFELKKNGVVVNLMKLDNNNYRVVDDTETGAASSHANDGEIADIPANSIVSDFVTVSSGNIVIWGVDSDKDYTLVEKQAPKGYNMIAGDNPVDVKTDDQGKVDAENNTGAELPSTGGIGTTLFYVIGGVLVIGAAVLLIAKRRMNDR